MAGLFCWRRPVLCRYSGRSAGVPVTVNLTPPPDLPAELTSRWRHIAGRLNELPADAFSDCPAAARSVSRVALCSDFVLSTLLREPRALVARVADDAPLSEALLAGRLRLSGCSEAQAMRTLRRVRNLEMARIAWRDLAGWSDLQASFSDLSALADAAIRAALQFAGTHLEGRFGRPAGPGGAPASLLVLAMGKLGGGELNFSSDVDLVLLFPDPQTLQRRPEVEPEVYYRRLAQLLVKLLDQVTEEGFVFRVDTRLRPFGAAGPLAVSVPALETYLIRHAREWERYAYLKARLLTGRRHAGELFEELLTPFVYRSYIDYGVFESLREMKASIAAEVARRDMAGNIKLGPGGIREIEFVVQALQLVRGGQNRALIQRSLPAALEAVETAGLLDGDAARALHSAYRFLRTLEHRLQAMRDQQTHDLPADAVSRSVLAYAMGMSGWAALEARLKRERERVEAQFAGSGLTGRGERDAAPDVDAWTSAWERGELREALAEAEVADADALGTQLEALRAESVFSRMDEVSRQRLAAVISQIMPQLAGYAAPGRVLRGVLPVLRAVGRRSAYLALLRENPSALARLLALADRSEFLVRQVAEHPLLLDELLDARVFDTPPTREELARSLQDTLAKQPSSDVEGRLEAIRSFKTAAVFRIACADRLGHLPLMKVSDRLTDTAELILQLALETAWSELVERYGEPLCGDGAARRAAGFAIIGYGKLGGLELGYGSDLDLVFVHDSAGSHQTTSGPRQVDNGRFFVRLVQRLIHFLSIQTRFGRLYEIDTRLRPSGRSGVPLPSLDAFVTYQREQAWVWEHQALLRSRAVAGLPRVMESFEAVRREVLIHDVDRDKLREEIIAMRRRMRRELSRSKTGEFDLKHDRGGVSDIEFLVDYWVLSRSDAFAELVTFPDKVRQLEALERTGLVSAERCRRLKAIYIALRERAHELALNEGGRIVSGEAFAEARGWVGALWDEALGAERV